MCLRLITGINKKLGLWWNSAYFVHIIFNYPRQWPRRPLHVCCPGTPLSGSAPFLKTYRERHKQQGHPLGWRVFWTLLETCVCCVYLHAKSLDVYEWLFQDSSCLKTGQGPFLSPAAHPKCLWHSWMSSRLSTNICWMHLSQLVSPLPMERPCEVMENVG